MLRICITKKVCKKARRNNASPRFPPHPRPDSDRDVRPAHYLILLKWLFVLEYLQPLLPSFCLSDYWWKPPSGGTSGAPACRRQEESLDVSLMLRPTIKYDTLRYACLPRLKQVRQARSVFAVWKT